MSELDLTMPIVELASSGLQAGPAQPTPIQRGRTIAGKTAPLRGRPTPGPFRGARIHQWRTVSPADKHARSESTTGGPLEPTVIVCRDSSAGASAPGVCALCWSGPAPLAGSVRRHNDETPRAICSRCLVTLEMLAVQFDPELRLSIQTPA